MKPTTPDGMTVINVVAIGGMLALAAYSLWITRTDHIAQLVVAAIAGWLSHAAATALTAPPPPP